MSEKDNLERQLSDMLTEGELQQQQDREEKERELISPRYEIRIQTKMDPIVEETKIYRGMAKELDDRYDKYMKRAEGDGASESKSLEDGKS
ncbi:hypothetical protein ABID47_004275 [Paenibacillus favisporus]|uniref:Uncharacterized protein n=1 Tax=Paenibacillus favisporus TaxID=221028 RepID=A0ABV2F7E2_9BACL